MFSWWRENAIVFVNGAQLGFPTDMGWDKEQSLIAPKEPAVSIVFEISSCLEL